jgi:PAS domain S-box-containing protein
MARSRRGPAAREQLGASQPADRAIDHRSDTHAILNHLMTERQRGALAVALAFAALLLAIGILNRWHMGRVEQAQAAVAHSREVTAELAQTVAALTDAETGQRGFLITGEERYLDPYNSAASNVKDRLARVAQLTADNRDQQEELVTAQSLVAEKLAELEVTIATRRSDGLEAARRIVMTDRGKKAMDDLRALTARMTTREQRLLELRLEAARASSRAARWTALASTGLALFAVAATFVGYRRHSTERARAAAAIATEREQLHVTLLGIGDGVIVVDRFSHVTMMNPVAERLTGWDRREAIGQPVAAVFRIVNEDTSKDVRNPIAAVIDTGVVQGLANHTVLVATDGTRRPVDDSAAPIRDHHGELLGVVLIFRDISQRRADERLVEQSLEEARQSSAVAEARQRELEDALQVKNQFLAAVSHELRTPINAIMGWAAMLRQGAVSADRVDAAIASIDRSARDLGQLIEDLVESSRLLTGKVRIAGDDVNLQDVAGDAIDSVRLSAENKGIVLDADLAPVPLVHGDRERLKQVLWNVLGNAIKFTPRGGRVALRMDHDCEHVTIAITDTGLGISASFLPHVFDHFRQVDEHSSSGLGLGLAIARQLVEMHGGTIEAQSDGEDLGSTFLVRLPAASAPEVVQAGTEAG